MPMQREPMCRHAIGHVACLTPRARISSCTPENHRWDPRLSYWLCHRWNCPTRETRDYPLARARTHLRDTNASWESHN